MKLESMGGAKDHMQRDERDSLRENTKQVLEHLDSHQGLQSGASATKPDRGIRTIRGIIKQRLPWFVTVSGIFFMAFVLVGTYITILVFSDWFLNLETSGSRQWVMESDSASQVNPDVDVAAVWSEGDPIDRMRLNEMFQAQQIAVKQVKAAHSVSERDIELISTGFDENRVPYAVLSGRKSPEQTCQVGDKILDAEVMGIFPDQVVLDLGGQRFSLNVTGKDTNGRPLAPESGVQFIGESTPAGLPTETSRHNKRKLLGQSRLKRDGDGFTVVTADYHSPLGNAGVGQGDTLLAINGIILASRTGNILAYERLTDKSSVQVDFMRNGVRMATSVSLP